MKLNKIKRATVIFTFLLLSSLFCVQAFGQADAQIPFECSSGLGYILTNTSVGGNNVTSLLSFDLTSGANAVIKANLLPATPADQRFYNGFGYNTKDNYLYGYRYNTNQIVKVGADGSIVLLSMTGTVSSGSYAAGDVSPDGILYLFGSNRFISVNLNSGAPDYLVATQKLAYSSTINDFAFSPVDGKIYGITSTATRQLFRFDPVTNTMTILGNVGGLTSETNDSFGTAFMDNEGNLYVGNNTSGNIYKIAKPNLLTTGSSVSASLYSSALAGKTPGDGARCSSQIILPKANNDLVCKPAVSDDALLISVAANDAAGSYALDNSSVRLIDGSNQRVTSITTAQGIFSVNTTSGQISFQPAAGFTSGTTSVTYSIADNQGNISAAATITVSICPPMPVKLISFQAKTEQQTVQLTWSTSEESNADRFIIERSNNAKTWLSIGEEKAAGESSAIKDYDFTDEKSLEGINYYRLRMIDNDNTFTYSRIVNALNADESSLTFFPNPSRDFVTINGLKGDDKIRIINGPGKLLFFKVSTESSYQLDFSKLSAGIYFILVTDSAGNITIHRIVKQ